MQDVRHNLIEILSDKSRKHVNQHQSALELNKGHVNQEQIVNQEHIFMMKHACVNLNKRM